MPTTIRVEDPVKEDFDKLQGLLQSETGLKLSQSELLGRLLRVARRHEAELFQEGQPAWRPPSWEQIDKLLSSLPDDMPETDASKVDEVLYGGDPDE